MAIMLEEIEFLELPDVFGRMPVDYPSEPITEIGPFFETNLYEVRCGNLQGLIKFYWDGVLIGEDNVHNTVWPEQTLPYLPTANTPDGVKYFYYATGKCYARMWNIFDNNIIYCYPIQRFEMPA
jgi:hypothetical protein